MVRRGVSPVVAVVLLIGVAISVGILASSWVTQLTVQMMSDTTACNLKTEYIIDSVSFNKTGEDTLLIKLTNKKDLALYGFGVQLENSTRIVYLNSSNWRINQGGITINEPIGREQSAYVTVNLSINYTGLGGTLTKVKVLNDACDEVPAETTSITQY